MGPIQASLRHLVRSESEPEAERVSRSSDLRLNFRDGVRELRQLSDSSRVLRVEPDWTYSELYRQLLALFTPGAQLSQVLLIGAYEDPGATLKDDSLDFEPYLLNTRYQYHLCDQVAGDQAFPLIHEDRRMLELLGISPPFSYYLEPIIGGRVFDCQSRMLELETLPKLRLIRPRAPLTW